MPDTNPGHIRQLPDPNYFGAFTRVTHPVTHPVSDRILKLETDNARLEADNAKLHEEVCRLEDRAEMLHDEAVQQFQARIATF